MTDPAADRFAVPAKGRCNCGRVEFRMDAAPIITHCCHCRSCQKISGTAFSINAMIEAAHLSITRGETARFGGEGLHETVQCSFCRSTLWSHIPKLGPAIAIVGVGMLDEGDRLQVEAHYFIRSKHPWIVVPADLPAFDQLGDPGKAGVRERLAAALAGGGEG